MTIISAAVPISIQGDVLIVHECLRRSTRVLNGQQFRHKISIFVQNSANATGALLISRIDSAIAAFVYFECKLSGKHIYIDLSRKHCEKAYIALSSCAAHKDCRKVVRHRKDLN